MEKQYSIPRRWLPSDALYKECEVSFDKKEDLLLQMWQASSRRMFLLKLKKKYAGMHITKPIH